MDKELLEKVTIMSESGELEMQILAHKIFYSQDPDPHWDDYCKIVTQEEYLEPILFYRLKSKGRIYIKERKMYVYNWNAVTDDQLRNA